MNNAFCLVLSVAFAVTIGAQEPRPIEELAQEHVDTLRLSGYMTAHEVAKLDLAPEAFAVVVDRLRGLGITRVFVEVYRGGFIVPVDTLATVRDAYAAAGFEVYGGIATVPGGDVGVRQEGPLGWFNWQNEKTQRDLAAIMRAAAPVFSHFIVDDFLCTGDVSAESREAKGDRSWSEYRRDLLTRVAEESLVGPARAANPDIHMIIKYPQWYDLFHVFGYDVVAKPPLFDEVYIGTETRGARTQRYGFVQPYEGFVNFRWLSALAGEKTGGAWFDHGDTGDHDFVEQAYQSVVAGAKELVLFHFGALMEGHPDHPRLVDAFPTLVELAKAVAADPVHGAVGYKPPHSDAGHDLYLMDFIGMLGVPLIPSPTFPSDAAVVFLPTQAATDRDIQSKVMAWVGEGRTLIMTAGFLSESDQALRDLAGFRRGAESQGPLRAQRVGLGGEFEVVPQGLDVAYAFVPDGAEVVLEAEIDGRPTPFLTRHRAQGAAIYVLNVHTFSQADFDAVNEVLLAPRELGLLNLPREHATVLRNVFLTPLGMTLDAPARVTFQPFGDRLLLYNYNEEAVDVVLAHGQHEQSLTIPARAYHLERPKQDPAGDSSPRS
jgi:hypothetical protein